MSVVVRKFLTPWAAWSKRWVDPRMAPYQAPLFVADLARQGVLVGPYMSERAELRDEFVAYPGKSGAAIAARELCLRPADLQPASAWLAGEGALVRAGAPDLHAAMAAAVRGDTGGYKASLLLFVKGLCQRIDEERKARARRAGPDEREDLTAKAISPEFRAKLQDRDARVDASARQVLADLQAQRRTAFSEVARARIVEILHDKRPCSVTGCPWPALRQLALDEEATPAESEFPCARHLASERDRLRAQFEVEALHEADMWTHPADRVVLALVGAIEEQP